MSTLFYQLAYIIHNSTLDIIRLYEYNCTDKIYRKVGGIMEYMSCPEAAKNGEFQKDGYKYFAQRTAYRVFQNLGICG